MLPKVDSGGIIAVKRFPLHENDTVYSLTQRCYKAILQCFYELMNIILSDGQLPESKEVWKRRPYTRKQLNELCLLTPQMSGDEIERRLKATTFGEKIWARVKNGETTLSFEDARARGLLS
jgi:methionyl-tRNA formyltransferase